MGTRLVVPLVSPAGVEGEPVQSDEMILHIGNPETVPEFSEALRGLEPGASTPVTIDYPANYSSPRLAGRKVTFNVTVKGLRRKDLPEANDEFAADMGDFKSINELREDLRRNIAREKEGVALGTTSLIILRRTMSSPMTKEPPKRKLRLNFAPISAGGMIQMHHSMTLIQASFRELDHRSPLLPHSRELLKRKRFILNLIRMILIRLSRLCTVRANPLLHQSFYTKTLVERWYSSALLI